MWGSCKRGVADPTYRVHDGLHWRALNTGAGPATLAVRPLDAAGLVEARAWGPGAEVVLDLLPTLLGAADDPSGFAAAAPAAGRTAPAPSALAAGTHPRPSGTPWCRW